LCKDSHSNRKRYARQFYFGALLEIPLYYRITANNYKNMALVKLGNSDYYDLALFIYWVSLSSRVFDYNMEECIQEINKLNSEDRLFCTMGLGFSLAEVSCGKTDKIKEIFNRLPIIFRSDLYKEAGVYFWNSNFNIMECNKIFEKIEPGYELSCLEGIKVFRKMLNNPIS